MSNQPNRTPSKLAYEQSSQALQKRPASQVNPRIVEHKTFLDARMKKIGEWVTQGIRPEALVRFVLRDMEGQNGAALRECSQESIYCALLACAVTGLEPGALKGEAYLVPYAKEATFITGYRGIIKQARRSREVVGIHSNVVYEGDEFDVDLGSAHRLVHKPRIGRDGSEQIVAAYAIARMASGQQEIEVMDRADLDKVRKASRNGPAWRDWADQMQRKAPIRRLGKRLPLGADYYVALALDHALTDPDTGEARPDGPAAQRRVIDSEARDAAATAERASESAESMRAQAGEITDDEAAEIARIEREQADN